jgi:hypothetical protein
MDEDQYRSVYQEINQTRCIYEKALNNRRCDCAHKQRFLLATREGVGCSSEARVKRCTRFLNKLRESSRFALKVITIDGPLPHNKELRVQAGGCSALQSLLTPEKELLHSVDDIDSLLEKAIAEYGDIESIPYGELVKGVLRYKVREKRTRN